MKDFFSKDWCLFDESFHRKLWNSLHLIAVIWFNGITSSSKNHFVLCGQRLSFRKCHVLDISWQKWSFFINDDIIEKEVDVFRNFRHTNLVYKWQNIWYYQTFSHLYTPYKKSSFISKPYQFQMYLFCISDIKGWRTLCTVCKWWHLCSIYAFASHPSYEGRQDMSVCTKRNP